ncbi:MAG: bifunctional folylpolyglutamate synthase/dihydrofolate synthase, partial [Alphaproteobacteria bacterium]|nr:bifunctional folylpolyglutamate synthase/dihydrofolate synthase [Alphaproteobacteria bacterium]
MNSTLDTFLARLHHPMLAMIDLSLDRMVRLLSLLGNPQKKLPPVLHVAGTNGKGSLNIYVQHILEAAGYKVHRYTSPHLVHFSERIILGGKEINNDYLESLVRHVSTVLTQQQATFFEATTAAAFLAFAENPADVLLLETGMGGKLDATNVIAKPMLTAITPISFDHTEYLGKTLTAIAGEKAGIIKRGVPVVSGATHASARRVIRATAARRHAPLLELGRDFSARFLGVADPTGDTPAAGVVRVRLPAVLAGPGSPEPTFSVAMAGPHQAENASLAVVAARWLDALGHTVPEDAIAAGLRRAVLPARVQVISRRPLVVVDAAHNVASMEALLDTLAAALSAHRPRVLVFAASADKQIERMLRIAAGSFDHVIVTRYATNPRAATVERLVAACRAAGLPPAEAAGSPADALVRARR